MRDYPEIRRKRAAAGFWRFFRFFTEVFFQKKLLTKIPETRRKYTFGKGGLISESFSLWFKSPKKGAKLRP